MNGSLEIPIALATLIVVGLAVVQAVGPLIVTYRLNSDSLEIAFLAVPLRIVPYAKMSDLRIVAWYKVFGMFFIWKYRSRPFADSILIRLKEGRRDVLISPRNPREFITDLRDRIANTET